jgi:hypothetical protein
MSNHGHTLLTHRLVLAIVFRVKTHTKTCGNMDTLLYNRAPKLGASANTDTRHQNGMVNRRILLNLNAR